MRHAHALALHVTQTSRRLNECECPCRSCARHTNASVFARGPGVARHMTGPQTRFFFFFLRSAHQRPLGVLTRHTNASALYVTPSSECALTERFRARLNSESDFGSTMLVMELACEKRASGTHM